MTVFNNWVVKIPPRFTELRWVSSRAAVVCVTYLLTYLLRIVLSQFGHIHTFILFDKQQ